MPGPGARHMLPPVAPRPPLPAAVPKADKEPQANQPKSRVPELEKHLVDQLSTEEQNLLNSKFKEATEADKKVLLQFCLQFFFLGHAIVTRLSWFSEFSWKNKRLVTFVSVD